MAAIAYRLKPEIHEKLKEIKRLDGISQEDQITRALQEYYGGISACPILVYAKELGTLLFLVTGEVATVTKENKLLQRFLQGRFPLDCEERWDSEFKNIVDAATASGKIVARYINCRLILEDPALFVQMCDWYMLGGKHD